MAFVMATSIHRSQDGARQSRRRVRGGQGLVEEAIAATAQVIADANRLAEAKRDAAWRESFKPHAYLVGSQNRPSQITFYGMTGARAVVENPLDLSQPPVTYALQAHEFVA